MPSPTTPPPTKTPPRETLPTRDDVAAAHARIQPHIRRTPVMEAGGDFLPAGASLSLKLEFLQHAGSFKTRGAFNNLVGRSTPPAGIATASGGNHGAAVAYAAQQLGLPARIFVPEISPAAKVNKIRACGAEVVSFQSFAGRTGAPSASSRTRPCCCPGGWPS